MPPADVSRLSRLGPFFALQDSSTAGRWHSLRELVDGPALDDRVEHVRSYLARMTGGEIERRVAASTMSLGLFARLVSPVVGATVLGVRLPAITFDDTHWQPVDGGPWPLALDGPDRDPDLPGVVTDVLLPLAEAIARRHSLSPRVLHGNIASGLFGAVGMVGSARPDLFATARDLGVALLDGPLAGTGRLDGGFVRESCCLYYRIPGGGYCGDCVLAHR